MNDAESFIRNGLLYETHDGLNYHYTPSTDLIVDGIRYVFTDMGTHVRPIVAVIDDHLNTCRCKEGAFPMWFSSPPTERELDRWVRTGVQP